jgi:hypothetical protein
MAKNQSEDNQSMEKLTNKAEAMRRALGALGDKAMPTELQGYLKEHFDVDMTTKVISVYKSKLGKRKSKRGRKSSSPVEQPIKVKSAVSDSVNVRDLRSIKELMDRHGAARLRELLELVSP